MEGPTKLLRRHQPVENHRTRICTNPKILCFLERLFMRSPRLGGEVGVQALACAVQPEG